MAKALVTQEAVEEAANALLAEGLDPSTTLVQARLGVGSYTTIQRALREWERKRAETPAVVVEIPSEHLARANEWFRALWATATSAAQQEAQVVKDEAQAKVEAMSRQHAEALAEIQRLEGVEVSLTDALEGEKRRSRELELEVARLGAEAKRVANLEGELDALRREYGAGADIRAALVALPQQIAALIAASGEKSRG
jgi:Plasmid replication region DNA-binding N-term